MNRTYIVVKILLACLFVVVLVITGVTAYSLLTKGFSLCKVLLLGATFVLAWFGGCWHGDLHRKLDAEDQNNEENQ